MEASTQIILSGLLTFGVPLAFAVRELIVVRRPRPGSWGGDGPPPPAPVTPPPDTSPEWIAVRKPLPDCLIPKPMDVGRPVRVLEPV